MHESAASRQGMLLLALHPPLQGCQGCPFPGLLPMLNPTADLKHAGRLCGVWHMGYHISVALVVRGEVDLSAHVFTLAALLGAKNQQTHPFRLAISAEYHRCHLPLGLCCLPSPPFLACHWSSFALQMLFANPCLQSLCTKGVAPSAADGDCCRPEFSGGG